MTTFTLRQLQEEHAPWARHNFGERPAWQPLLGIVEEVGELLEAIDCVPPSITIDGPRKLISADADVRDAMGDIMVYMVDFVTRADLDIGSLTTPAPAGSLAVHLGRLSHGYLKNAQGIRGGVEKHRLEMYTALAGIYQCLCALTERGPEELLEIVEETWSRVKKRDWKKDAAKGGEA